MWVIFLARCPRHSESSGTLAIAYVRLYRDRSVVCLMVLPVEKLQISLVQKLTQVMLEAHALQERHYDAIKTRITAAESVVVAIDPVADQSIFIDHNGRPFNVTPDWAFEPCSTHYDTVSLQSIMPPV